MQSCYMTGQKRVGKSSLARAVQSSLEKTPGPTRYHVLYLECGEFMHSTGEQTLAALGQQLEDYFTHYLDRNTNWDPQDYSSSLSPLNQLLETLRRENGFDRFVVILDEFDEINESLYSHGEFANTFFLNLRTLSSKRNLVFVLVGAEKMPYLMSSQGEKLNKFDRESLDSFDQKTEWSDFVSLVRDPVIGSLVFHDRALRKLYELTDGHPYFRGLYTKITSRRGGDASADEKPPHGLQRFSTHHNIGEVRSAATWLIRPHCAPPADSGGNHQRSASWGGQGGF